MEEKEPQTQKPGSAGKKKVIIIALITALICVIGVGVIMYFVKDRDTTVTSLGTYNIQPLPDYTQFLPENAINAMFDENGGCAYLKDADIFYQNGEYKNIDTPACVYEDGKLYITTNEYGKQTAEELAASMGAEYVVYDQKLAVFSYKKDFADVFSDIYTLEALSLRLSGAKEADIVNAFITLPNFVSNGTTNSVFYTEPNLQLGLQTEIYGLQLDGYDTGYEKVDKAPMIVAGQGESNTNNTLVRVFNNAQACTAQFLAFPPEVTGGVQVKAGTSSWGQPLIATAAFDATLNAAKCIKVYDTFGTLVYSFTPEGIEAPYTIEVGKFIKGSDKEQIFVASKLAGSDTVYGLYDIDNGSFIQSVNGGFDSKISAQRVTLSAYLPSGEASEYQKIIVTFLESKAVYYLDCTDSSWTLSDIKLTDDVTGVYASAFDGGLIASLSEDTFSNVRIYGTGVSDNLEGSLINVGYKENRFYSTFAENNPDGYVDFAQFQHIRTDLANNVLSKLGTVSLRKVEKTLNEAEYGDWSYVLTNGEIKTFHSQYNMWEPCFTHRWGKTPATMNLISVKDEETGLPKYASIGRDDIMTDYNELTSVFLIGTYADGIIDLAKMRIYPLRTMLQQLAPEFRGENGEPERLVAVSPVHEQEINVEGSVGDYNPKMIEGFRKYLVGLFGNVDNINKRFGTNFVSESDIDAPRYDPNAQNAQESRGAWDVYGESDYFTYWSLYTRNVVNERLMEAYREALLAGFPPEAINAHQIPEGDAVTGFLGQADTRLSPTDVVSICGTAYGGTRYGLFYSDMNNFINLAYKAGHKNITLGEYSSLANDRFEAYDQLKYLFDSGVKFTHIIVPYDTSSAAYTRVYYAERDAISMLQEENQPRTASTGGSGASLPVMRGDKSYNIVQLGDSDMNGLLKSIYADGSWEGSVYVVPFHSQVGVSSVKMTDTDNGFVSEPIKDMQYGDQVELTFLASYSGDDTAYVTIEVYHAGYLMEDSKSIYELSSNETPYRYVLSNQLALEDVEIRVTFTCADQSKINTENVQCTAQIENVAHKYFGDFTAEASIGGVTFDIIE